MPTSASADPILQAEEVVSGYGEITVLRGVSVSIPTGCIVTLIGANGAGKSTMLKTIFGLVKPTSGKILFYGNDITRTDPATLLRKGISYVPQGRSNFPRMTVRENLEMGAFIRSDDIQADVDALLERFPVLKAKQNSLAGLMSGGEQQILEMAMALMLAPKLLLIDEPSLGLDPKMVRIVLDQVQEINRIGVTVLMVEQNARMALAISTYAFILELGRNRLQGTGADLLSNETVRKMYLGGASVPAKRPIHDGATEPGE